MTPEEYISKVLNYQLPREYALTVNKKHVHFYIYKTKPEDTSKIYARINLVEALSDDGLSDIHMSVITYYITMPYEREIMSNINKDLINVKTLTDYGGKRQYIVVSIDII